MPALTSSGSWNLACHPALRTACMMSIYERIVSGQSRACLDTLPLASVNKVAVTVMMQEFICMCTCCKSKQRNERVKSTLEHQVGNSIDTKKKSSSLQERKDSFAATNLPTDMIAALLTQASIYYLCIGLLSLSISLVWDLKPWMLQCSICCWSLGRVYRQ